MSKFWATSERRKVRKIKKLKGGRVGEKNGGAPRRGGGRAGNGVSGAALAQAALI